MIWERKGKQNIVTPVGQVLRVREAEDAGSTVSGVIVPPIPFVIASALSASAGSTCTACSTQTKN